MMTTAYFTKFDRGDLSSQQETGDVCIANISPLERRKRLLFGVRQLVTALVVLVVLIFLHVNPLWRLSLLFMFWAAAVGYFQAKDKT